jgi:uncharacterized membrane protein
MNKLQKFYYYIGTVLIFLGSFVIISSFYNTIKWLWAYGFLIIFLGLIALFIFKKRESNSTDEKEEKDNEEVSE